MKVTPPEVLSFDLFVQLLRKSLRFDATVSLEEGVKLFSDIGMDSLQVFELWIVLDENGSDIDEDMMANKDVTVGDVYHAYVESLVNQSLSPTDNSIESAKGA